MLPSNKPQEFDKFDKVACFYWALWWVHNSMPGGMWLCTPAWVLLFM